eukprot:Tbor_TRINITY_DN3370_c0_g1::TRINITY_DN3370_c0_g1_i1::g.23549::m.23549/K06669/SMC3, CSPG6; structural maintenance of chromosome 3 (chondroitin sulfate proteoglycan 6)
MHIKNIIISGFRSYREHRFESNLSPKHNVIVGRNGSGKSNFFAAVQFVLSEKFSNLQQKERHELFHQGSGRPALSVYVEIVCDNTDGRFQIPGSKDDQEVRIRRIIGLKQDEYRVNDRKYSHSEVRQLLESAGFSSSNPYYIVEQGKIVNLANMSESGRYELLKDVAGTKVYEARREESKKVLSETSIKHKQIDESIKKLDDRLKELEAESSELKLFQETDMKRRSISYCIFHEQVTDARKQLGILDSTWGERMAYTNQHRDQEMAKEEEANAAARMAETIEMRLKGIDNEKKTTEAELVTLIKRKTKLELSATDAAASSSRETEEKKALMKEKMALSAKLEESRVTLDIKKDALRKKQAESDTLMDSLSKKEIHLDVLQAKRGRKEKFKSKSDRDKWINEEIKRNNDLMNTGQSDIDRLKGDIEEAKNALAEEKKTLKDPSAPVQQQPQDIAQTRKQLIDKRDNLNKERRRLRDQIKDHETVVRRATEEVDRSRAKMDRATRNDIRQGLQSLRDTLRELKDPKLNAAVHGQLIELIDVEPQYMSAVEVTIGNALFNVVVDSFDVSARLLDHINSTRKPGRITFLPLDTCRSTPKNIATTSTYSPLISHVRYDPLFAGCIAELLGRTVVATTMEVGAKLVKELDTDVVTVDGDQFNRRGGITGGYMDKRNMKLTTFITLKETNEKLQEQRSQLDKLSETISTVEQNITNAMQEIEQLNSKDSLAQNNLDNQRRLLRLQEENIRRYENQIDQAEKAIEVLRRHNSAIRATNDAFTAELQQEITSSLSSQETISLDKLQSEVSSLRNSAASVASDTVQLATEVQVLQDTVNYMISRFQNVDDRLSTLSSIAVGSGDGARLERELKTIIDDIKNLEARLTKISEEYERLVGEKQAAVMKEQQLSKELAKLTSDQQKEKDSLENAQNNRALLLQKREDAQSEIRKLGVIPADALEKFGKYSIGKLMLFLTKTNEELRKYAHVNQKALDQHNSLSEARTRLVEQLESINKELESIHGMMKRLDDKKRDAIDLTFKQVQHNFAQAFSDIVGTKGSSASLQMVKNPEKSTAQADPFIAVRIEVCFGLGSPVSELAQLSGGQKSLVALALIFAIQRSDPAPFYLFDEIDAALDPEYRANVAKLLEKESESAQFITATFKKELLLVADRVLGISFNNKVSHIQYISKEEGIKLLGMAANDERNANKRTRDE